MFFFPQSALTPVAGDKLSAAGKFVDCEQAVVGTTFAPRHRALEFEGNNFLEREHRRNHTFFVMFPGDQRGSEGAHDTGDVRTDSAAARYALKTPQHGVVVKRSALDDDIRAEVFWVGQLNYFKQCIFDDGDGKPGGDICDRSPFLLRLFYFGIHKYGTAGSEINWIFSEKRELSKILYLIIQRAGECFDKGAAPRGTCLVQLHAINGVVFYFDTFHVLAADI